MDKPTEAQQASLSMGSGDLPVPDSIVAAMRGRPQPGSWDDACLLLTSTAEGVVDVCMLSRAEVDAFPDAIYAVVASRNSPANLDRSGAGTLVIFAAGGFTYLAVRRDHAVATASMTGYRLVVTRVLTDDVGVEVCPSGTSSIRTYRSQSIGK